MNAPRAAKGFFWTHPLRYLAANRGQATGKKDWLDAAPVVHSTTSVEVAVVGANPILVALVAREHARKGKRVAIALFDAQDPWPYEVLAHAVINRVLGHLAGSLGRDVNETLAHLYSECAQVVAASNGVCVAQGFMLGTAMPDFDGQCWFYVEAQRPVQRPTGVQEQQLTRLRMSLRKLPQLRRRAPLGRIRMVRAETVVLCSYDHSLVMAYEECDESGYQKSNIPMAARLERVGTALRFVEQGEPWIRRALADLVAVRDAASEGEGLESILREAYQ